MTNYSLLKAQLAALLEGIPYPLANLANAAAFLYEMLPDLNWAGFYLSRREGEEEVLILGPFQGRTACIRILYGHGVCGTAAQKDEPQLVPDVHAFPGHIACDAASASEVVIPLHDEEGQVFGVLDLDSPTKGRFTGEDLKGLCELAEVIEIAGCPC